MVWPFIIATAAAVLAVWLVPVRVVRRRSLEGIDVPGAVRAYDAMSRTPGFWLLRQLVLRRLGGWKPEGTLADVGCGPGYLLRAAAKKFPRLRLVGVDIAEEALDTARRNLDPARVELLRGGSGSLPLPDGSCDFVVSTFSLHHWSRPGEIFAEFSRVLRPGGRFLVMDLRRDAPAPVHLFVCLVTAVVVPRELRRIREPVGSLRASYTAAEAKTLLSETPFEDCGVERGLAWMYLRGRKGG
ncbi:MAG TPA: class I SAM-dependent methyltransferase, partial [bacterium]|nr:class I SAM-dependent methyltransferase [bacterium]